MNDVLIPVQQLINKLQKENQELRVVLGLSEVERKVIKSFLYNSPSAEGGLYKEERFGLSVKRCNDLKREFMQALSAT